MIRSASLFAVLALSAITPAQAGTCGYPNSYNAINSAGDIAGYYGSGLFHGFVNSGGSCTNFDFPGATVTTAYGINDSGLIVGGSNSGAHGFVYDGGSFVSLDVPGASYTQAYGVNNGGQIVGVFHDSQDHGFVDNGGLLTTLDVPGATCTVARGINNHGDIVGSYDDCVGNGHGFLYSGGVFTLIDVPGSPGTHANGINDRGDIVGSYHDDPANLFYEHAYLLRGGVFTTLDVLSYLCCNPDGHLEEAMGINNSEEIVGYRAQNTVPAGFIVDAGVPEPATAVLFATGLVIVWLGGRRRAITYRHECPASRPRADR